jgi:hypothetical protein
MYTEDVPRYDIDLSLPEGQRWLEVIEKDGDAAAAVVSEALEDIKQQCPPWLMRMGSWALHRMYHVFGGRYRGEVQAWADALDAPVDLITAGNCSYELSHILGEQPYGCTAGMAYTEKHGMVHVRNMDWPLESIGEATRIFHFHNGEGGHDFITVGVPSFVGALSGMVPGRYSVTLNWAPPDGLPSFDFGPAFLLREVLEKCRFPQDAVTMLRDTPLAAPAFFVVCGTHHGYIIQRTKGGSQVDVLRSDPVVGIDVMAQANHFTSRSMRRYNEGVDLEYSEVRAATLREHLRKVPASASLDRVAKTLDVEPVLNDNTFQQMVFAPRTGKMKAWRWVD